MPDRREVWCPNCHAFQPLDDERGPHSDELNPWPWHDLVCGACRFVIATIRVVPEAETRWDYWSSQIAALERQPEEQKASVQAMCREFLRGLDYLRLDRERQRLNEAVDACAICGTTPARGFAMIGDDRYCHGDGDPDPTCYMLGQFIDANVGSLRFDGWLPGT